MDRAEALYGELLAPIEDRVIDTITRIIRDPDDAADVLQEIQAYIWRKLRKIHRHPNPHAYIMRLCVSRSYDALRRRSRLRKWETPLGEERATGRSESARADDPLVNAENLAAIHRAVASLPDAQGQALLLRAVENEPYHTIGQILGCSAVTARSHVSKARARLAEILGELGVL